jgi:uncharacterized protein (TIGR02996 family)
MTHEDFWQAIHEAPDDDTPRLVYADWLDDHGEGDRAEFIRLQVRAARLDEDDPERIALWKRIGELQSEHEARWLQPLRRWVPLDDEDSPSYVVWMRGFVAFLEIDPVRSNLLDRLAPFLAEHPVEELGLSAARKTSLDTLGQGVARCSALDNLRTLALHEGDRPLGTKAMQALGEARHLARLRRLQLSGDLDQSEVRALFQSALLDRITYLEFDVAAGEGEQAVATMLETGRAARLEGLQMGSCYIGDGGLHLLCEGQALPALKHLGLGHNELTDQGVARLARSALLGQLEVLELDINDLTRASCGYLGRSKRLANLVELDLGHTHLDAAGIRALLPGLNPDSLRSLRLTYSDLDADAAAELAGSPHLSGLRTLDLAGNPIGDRGAVALAGSAHLASLRELRLYATGIGAKGARALARSPYLGKITSLWLDEETIPQAGQQLLRERFGNAVM